MALLFFFIRQKMLDNREKVKIGTIIEKHILQIQAFRGIIKKSIYYQVLSLLF